MRIDTLEALGAPSTFANVAARYAGAPWLPLFLETEDLNDPETNGVVGVRVVDGDLTAAALHSDTGPWAIVVDGSLVIDGDIELSTSDYIASTLIVTGGVRARSVRYSTSMRVEIRGDLIVENVIGGFWGDASAFLAARSIEARCILLDSATSISARSRIDALIVGGRGWTEFRADAFLDELGDLDAAEAFDRVRAGGPLPIDELAHRTRRGLLSPTARALLDTDPAARALVAEPDGLDVLSDWLQERGETFDRDALAAAIARRR